MEGTYDAYKAYSVRVSTPRTSFEVFLGDVNGECALCVGMVVGDTLVAYTDLGTLNPASLTNMMMRGFNVIMNLPVPNMAPNVDVVEALRSAGFNVLAADVLRSAPDDVKMVAMVIANMVSFIRSISGAAPEPNEEA